MNSVLEFLDLLILMHVTPMVFMIMNYIFSVCYNMTCYIYVVIQRAEDSTGTLNSGSCLYNLCYYVAQICVEQHVGNNGIKPGKT